MLKPMSLKYGEEDRTADDGLEADALAAAEAEREGEGVEAHLSLRPQQHAPTPVRFHVFISQNAFIN